MRSFFSKVTGMLLGALCMISLSTFSGAASDELVAAAQKEGKLRIIVYSSLKNAAKAFEKKVRYQGRGNLCWGATNTA